MTRTLVVVGLVWLSSSCGKSENKGATNALPTGGSAAAVAPNAPPTAVVPGTPPAAAKMTCDEEQYQKWIAMKKEESAALAGGLQAAGKKVEAAGKNTAEAKGEAMAGLVATGQNLEAIHAKYGFERQAAIEWNHLTNTVMQMRSLDNPMMKGTVETFRKMQAAGGQQKEGADRFFKEQEDQSKKAEANARVRFGDTCVDLMLKHSAEILDVEMAAASAVLGGPKKK